jgi:hypothetical protein
MTTWAFLYGHPGTDPHTDRTVIESGGLRTILVPVPDESQAPAIAVELIESDAIALLELCGGFGAVDAARVIDAVHGRVPVGHVAYALEALEGAARYKAAFAGRQ